MKKISTLLLALCTLTLSMPVVAAEEEIRVQLSSDSELSPIYFGRMQCSDNSLDQNYLIQLEMVIEKDLCYNANTKITKRDPQKETLLANSGAAAFPAAKWKEWSLPHVIRAEVKNKQLELKVFSTATGSLKTFPEIALTGQLSHDRRAIHILSDSILKALFGVDGVCSTKILFSYQLNSTDTSESKWRAEIWECDWDGHNAKQITKDGSYSVTPVPVPSNARTLNEKFFYVSYKFGQPKILMASLKDGVGKKIIDLRGNQMLPAISSKKDKLAYICDASGRADLFLQLIDPDTYELGQPKQIFSYPQASEASPTFSPDGGRIAFVSDKDGSPRIYIIPASFSDKRAEAQLISRQNKENSCPSWSPDGTKIAYSSKSDGIRQIWIYDLKTGEETQLTSGPGHKENPSWAPNSTHLVFNSTENHSSDLYVVNLRQPEAVKITKGPGKKHYPAWSTRKD